MGKQITKTKYIMKTFITALLISVAMIDTNTQGANALQLELEPPTKMELEAFAKMDQEEIDEFLEEKYDMDQEEMDQFLQEKYGRPSDFCFWCASFCLSSICPVWCWWCHGDDGW